MYLTITPPEKDTKENWVEYIKKLGEFSDNKQRKADSYRLYKLYKGHSQREETKKALTSRIGNQVHQNKHPIWTQNVLRLGVKMLASTYDGVVERSIGEVEEGVFFDVQTKMWDSINTSMSTVSDLLVYERMALIQVVNKSDKLIYHTYNQYQYDLVYQNDELVAVILSDYGVDHEKTNYFIYTSENTWHLFGDNLVSQEVNELNVLPFIVAYAEERGFHDYLEPMIEYADAQVELNCILSGNLYTHQLQSHAVLWERLTPDSAIGETVESPGGSLLDSDQIGPQLALPSAAQATILYEDEEGRKEEIGYLTPGINFGDILGVGREYILNFFENMGIPRDAISIDMSGATVKPATAGYLAERKLHDLNSPYKSIFSAVEKELFNLSITVVNEANLFNVNTVDSNNFSVSFSSQPRRLDTLEITDLISLKNEGIIDEAEVLRILKGITRTEALNLLETMKLLTKPKEVKKEEKNIEETTFEDTE